jgi:hypothetical protein
MKSSGNGDTRTHTTVEGDDAFIARRMLDSLLGGRPERLLRCGSRLCLSTPRGLEVIATADYGRQERVGTGCRLLDAAAIADGALLLDETGLISRWSPDEGMRELHRPTRTHFRRMVARDDQHLLGRGRKLQLHDANSGALLAAGTVDLPGRLSSLSLNADGDILAARSQTLALLRRDGDQLRVCGTCSLGEGEILAAATTKVDGGATPRVVAVDELGWLFVLAMGEDGALHQVGSLDLELDGGVPERAGLVCDGPQVIVASGTRLVHLVDLRPPAGQRDPVLMATASVGTVLADVATSDDYVFLADAYQGLVVVARTLLEICHDDPVARKVALIDPDDIL